MPELIVRTGTSAGRQFSLDKDAEVGRGAESGVSLPDAGVSRRHAKLGRRSGVWYVEDLGSQNGTALNGRRLERESRLKDGDTLSFGGVLCAFQDEGSSLEGSVILSNVGHAVVGARDADAAMSGLFTLEKKESLADRARRLQLVYDVGSAVSATLDEDEMLELVLAKVFDVFPKADRGFVMLLDHPGGALKPRAMKTRSGAPAAITMSHTIADDVVKNRRGVLSVDAMTDDRFQEGVSIQMLGIRSLVCVPLLARDEVFGLLTLYSQNLDSRFEADDMSLLLALGAQVGLALANVRLHQRIVEQELLRHDLALARRVQAGFLPRCAPEVAGWAFAAHYAPALEVSGDFYSFIPLEGRHMGVAIGDVSGKGVSAALLMARLTSELRAQALSRTDPSEILARVNASLTPELDDGMFATLALLVLDADSGKVSLASAGHLPPLVRRIDGRVEPIPAPPNLAIGVQEDAEFQGETFRLRDGETVVLFTDGISEAERNGVLFGEQRLMETIAAGEGEPGGIVARVLLAVEGFLQGTPAGDDVTLVAVGPVPSAVPRAAHASPRHASSGSRT
jgi:sigma-B regulation protein RsbU (phosphoserine phosphatase)